MALFRMSCLVRFEGMRSPTLGRVFHGSESLVQAFTGAVGKRVSHAPGANIPTHRHDWPNLTIHLLGSYTEQVEEESCVLRGPSVTFQPAGNCHANSIGQDGLETIGILFDPAWIGSGSKALLPERAQCWQGGAVSGMARRLAGSWFRKEAGEQQLARQVRDLLRLATDSKTTLEPKWMQTCSKELQSKCPRSTVEIARGLNLHPAWLARAYKAFTGEGMHETIRRSRTLYALNLLQNSNLSLSEIATKANFCDQAHMTRCFTSILGQPPAQVRLKRDQTA